MSNHTQMAERAVTEFRREASAVCWAPLSGWNTRPVGVFGVAALALIFGCGGPESTARQPPPQVAKQEFIPHQDGGTTASAPRECKERQGAPSVLAQAELVERAEAANALVRGRHSAAYALAKRILEKHPGDLATELIVQSAPDEGVSEDLDPREREFVTEAFSALDAGCFCKAYKRLEQFYVRPGHPVPYYHLWIGSLCTYDESSLLLNVDPVRISEMAAGTPGQDVRSTASFSGRLTASKPSTVSVEGWLRKFKIDWPDMFILHRNRTGTLTRRFWRNQASSARRIPDRYSTRPIQIAIRHNDGRLFAGYGHYLAVANTEYDGAFGMQTTFRAIYQLPATFIDDSLVWADSSSEEAIVVLGAGGTIALIDAKAERMLWQRSAVCAPSYFVLYNGFVLCPTVARTGQRQFVAALSLEKGLDAGGLYASSPVRAIVTVGDRLMVKTEKTEDEYVAVASSP